jgi:endoglucanase
MKNQLNRGYNRDVTPERQRMRGRATALVFAFAGLLMLPFGAWAQGGGPFPTPTHGWNLGNTLEPPCGEGCWGGVASQNLINSVAANGFNTVRIPCSWDSNSSQGQINPTYMARVKEVVDWCLARNMVVIINCHWDNGWFDNENNFRRVGSTVNNKIISIWTQVANNFKNHDNRLLFQFSNEPPVDTAAETAVLIQYYQTFINTVRGTGGNNTNRWLVVSGPSTASDKTYDWFTLPSDPTPGRLVVDVHEYSPFNFTIMSGDQSWGNMFYFWGASYLHPTRLDRNPTWGNEDYILSEHTKMKNKFTSQGIPVIVGEYGLVKRQGYPDLTGWDYDLHLAARTFWGKYVHDTANSNGMKPFFWDTPGGLFDWNTGAVRDADMIRAVTGGAALPRPEDPGSCTASSTRVNAIVTTLVNVGGGKKRGNAVVTIVDNCGSPVAGATVTGDFTGDWMIAQTGLTGTTDASGIVTFAGSKSSNGNFNANFCVTSVVKSGLTYIPANNVQTCDSSN